MLPTLNSAQTKVLGGLVREHRKKLGLTLREYTDHVRGVCQAPQLSPWDVASLESRGLGLRYIPVIQWLVNEDILTPEAVDGVFSLGSQLNLHRSRPVGNGKGSKGKAKDPKPKSGSVRDKSKGRGGSGKSGKAGLVATK